MTTDELLLQAIAAGLTVEADGDRLLIRPKGQITEELRAAILAHRGEVLTALQVRESMPAILAPVPERPCTACERLHVGVYCVHYQLNIVEPGRLSRCAQFEQRRPALPWDDIEPWYEPYEP